MQSTFLHAILCLNNISLSTLSINEDMASSADRIKTDVDIAFREYMQKQTDDYKIWIGPINSSVCHSFSL